MREHRLGDEIDDFCVRCKRVMNHNVVSVINGEPAKVRCRICHSDHDYRHEQAPPPKVDLRKQALFKEVLKTVSPADAEAPDEIEVPAVIEELEEEPVLLDVADPPEVEAPPAPVDPPAAKAPRAKVARAKAKGRK